MFESLSLCGDNIQTPHHTRHPTASRIARNDRIDTIDVGFCELDKK